jgi:hypothetical protein
MRMAQRRREARQKRISGMKADEKLIWRKAVQEQHGVIEAKADVVEGRI